ncbi:MAG: archaemetzincin family Zn-dependent metalloprotease [Nitrososphaeria archaeon]
MSFKDKIAVYPVYNMDGYKYMTQVEAAIRSYEREPDVSIDVIPLSTQEYDSQRRQYKADLIIDRVAARRDSDKKGKVLGLTSVDISMPKMNYVFGVTNIVRGAAVLSTARLAILPGGAHLGLKTVEERIFKESAHEIGHLMGLTHCLEPTCIMSFSNSIKEVDDKLPTLCNACKEKLKSRR